MFISEAGSPRTPYRPPNARSRMTQTQCPPRPKPTVLPPVDEWSVAFLEFLGHAAISGHQSKKDGVKPLSIDGIPRYR